MRPRIMRGLYAIGVVFCVQPYVNGGKVQEKLKKYGIKFRPNKLAYRHLNGKVERSQKTDKAEF